MLDRNLEHDPPRTHGEEITPSRTPLGKERKDGGDREEKIGEHVVGGSDCYLLLCTLDSEKLYLSPQGNGEGRESQTQGIIEIKEGSKNKRR